MRQQISISRGSRGVWAWARQAAADAEISLSDFVASALREKQERDQRPATPTGGMP